MCGIAGYYNFAKNVNAANLRECILPMTQAFYRRGPDSGGVWIDAQNGLALGHRRLAIRDLSPLGHQPMVSPDGRYVLIYNGEIFNTDELLPLLEAKDVYPRGTSDTEVILLCCSILGIKNTLERMLGMFALALWDRQEQTLTLARDRFGVKPLYWSKQGPIFSFASELKSLRTLSARGHFSHSINRNALASLLRYGYIPAPHSIFTDVHKLPAACILQLNRDNSLHIESYWDPLRIATEGLQQPLDIREDNLDEHVNTLDAILSKAVSRRMITDVPLGAFLSGGIDSSTVVALMQKNSPNPIKTFSIGFEQQEYNEAPHAAAVAKHLGTDHTEAYMSPSDAFALIPHLSDMYDEPFADSSQLPTALISQLTRQSVTVALTGDGGDEIFAGYGRYAFALKNTPVYTVPSPLAKAGARLLQQLSPTAWNRLNKLLPEKFRAQNLGERLHNHARLHMAGDAMEYYHRICLMLWWYPDTVVIGSKNVSTIAEDKNLLAQINDPLARMQYVDSRLYLPDDILAKVDRASMYYSLETRVPLLDTNLYHYACRIPPAWRMRHGAGKYLLRKVLHNYVPKKLVERPKMGFGMPVGTWLRGPLRNWAQDLLAPELLRRQGFLRPEPVQRAWQRHQNRTSDWQYQLWSILMFQAWLNATLPSVTDEGNCITIEYAHAS